MSRLKSVDSISFKLKNNSLKLDPQRPTIYQIDGNSMRILITPWERTAVCASLFLIDIDTIYMLL